MDTSVAKVDRLRQAIRGTYLTGEAGAVAHLLPLAALTPQQTQAAANTARMLVQAVRAAGAVGWGGWGGWGSAGGFGGTGGAGGAGDIGIEAFLREYRLSTQEGVLLMCLAEALLRIPDHATADELIRDTLSQGDWRRHLGRSDSVFVNAGTWALVLTGRLANWQGAGDGDAAAAAGAAAAVAHGETAFASLKKMLAGSGIAAVRLVITRAVRIVAQKFVTGRSIAEALARSGAAAGAGAIENGSQVGSPSGFQGGSPGGFQGGGQADQAHTCCSFDMLGEAAMTSAASQHYFDAYHAAIAALSGTRHSISVKLSALHPRYEAAQRGRVLAQLPPRLLALACAARAAGIGLTIDAEESERLELSLDVFERVYGDPALAGYDGLGLALQAYQKRALAVIDWLAHLARSGQKRMPVRLVKGAYWDTEIKRAQILGLCAYPVFTRKAATDASYLACARQLLAAPDAFFSQFATHNAHTVGAILALSDGRSDFEFQRLHGMGEALYAAVRASAAPAVPVRVYAPVGSHADLLPYLVRRLLENGANSSFVYSVADPAVPLEQLIADPVAALGALAGKPHPRIALPRDLYRSEHRPEAGPAWRNSEGISFADVNALEALTEQMRACVRATQPACLRVTQAPSPPPSQPVSHQGGFDACALIGGIAWSGPARTIISPADGQSVVGTVEETTDAGLQRALAFATAAAPQWAATPAAERAASLERAADLIEGERATLMTLLVREAGKTLPDALAEVREAADFCRYYAALARRDFAMPLTLPGPAGEVNRLSLHGRGVFAAISPWNFPLAIFVGQVAAALAAGNVVLAKPARQTPLVAYQAVRLLHRAGIPAPALQFLPGPGTALGSSLAADPRVDGVVFTGSLEAAQSINRLLATRSGAIVPLIAETGGQNALIADSSVLPEQVVRDAVQSAFNSAGQRCSALRVLFVQEEAAERVLALLRGAMEELVIGDPMQLAVDVGPVIDAAAQRTLQDHIGTLRRIARPVCELALPAGAVTAGNDNMGSTGSFVAPCAFEIANLEVLEREVFGPVLHVIRYQRSALDQVIDAINRTGYGLTLGIASRIDATIAQIQRRARVGNIYVNRNLIGAVVGVQPFGGEGRSGTGPKAGGPHTLLRFATERSVSANTSAVGGNAALTALDA